MELKQLLKYFVINFAILYGAWFYTSLCLFSELCITSGIVVVAWTLAYFFYECIYNETISTENKAVLVTGCDTGFGNSLVKRLDQIGFHVFAGVLDHDGTGAEDLAKNCSNRLRILKLDVTKQEDVESAVKEIKQSGIPLWSIVNNAGIAVWVPYHWGTDVDEFKKVFDVNVFGMVRVTKNFIALLRESKGRIVNVSSAAGRISVPGMSHYCMSKHAVRVFSDVARRELSKQNVFLVVIEPVCYRTPILDSNQIKQSQMRIFNETPEEIKHVNDKKIICSGNKIGKLMNKQMRTNLEEVINAMQSAVTLKYPKLYYRCCGYIDVIVIFAFSHLPEVLLDLFFFNINNI